jgi:diadenosine tetraphosphate (Ap4A) HIT family hydrolase
MKKDCPYCTLPEIEERVLAKNDLAFAFLTYQPITPGHSLISPTRCVAKAEDLTEDEWRAILDLKKKVRGALIKTFASTGFNYAWNENKTAGQSVPHFHLHVVPRKDGDTGIYKYDPRSFIYRTEGRPITPEKELQEVAELIRDNL